MNKNKTISRRFEFEPSFYKKLMDDAKDNERSFPRHVMWIFKKYIEEVENDKA